MNETQRGQLLTTLAVVFLLVGGLLAWLNYRAVSAECQGGVIVRASWYGVACAQPGR